MLAHDAFLRLMRRRAVSTPSPRRVRCAHDRQRHVRRLVAPPADRAGLAGGAGRAARGRGDLRRLSLVAGEILVQTAADPSRRPFVVDAPRGRPRALGTRFTVRLDGPETLEAVHQGAVEARTADSGAPPIIQDPPADALLARRARGHAAGRPGGRGLDAGCPGHREHAAGRGGARVAALPRRPHRRRAGSRAPAGHRQLSGHRSRPRAGHARKRAARPDQAHPALARAPTPRPSRPRPPG